MDDSVIQVASTDYGTYLPYIALVISVITPVLTLVINHRYQHKMARYKFYIQRQVAVIENYIRCTGILIQHSKKNMPLDATDYIKAFSEVLMYLDSPLQDRVIELDTLMCDDILAFAAYKKLCVELGRYSARKSK